MKRVLEIPKNALYVGVGAAMQAARVIMDGYGKVFQIDVKHHHDFVTDIDRRSEATIIQHIRRAFPDHEILAEESGKHEQTSDYRWIIDPLDGTTNFIHGMPMFAVSIALEVQGELHAGVVYEPVRKELFTAEKNKGAFLNDRKIAVSTTAEKARCLLATGFPFRNFSMLDDYLRIFKYFMTRTSGIRRPGSAALDLCYLACGRYDGFWELNLNPWDMAAGTLIIEEAGGRITDFSGGDHFLYKGNIIGSNGHIHAWMLDGVKEVLQERLQLL
jgi:myo-inositol-1(or 4)-monophosphatase